ncbi:MAG: dihydroorotase [bacterium]
MDALLITNARIVNEGQIKTRDILIINGRIANIAPEICAQGVKQHLDAQGRYVLPGMIDDSVHIRVTAPTKNASDQSRVACDFQTESRAAIVGGITSILNMPDTEPAIVDQESLAINQRHASEKSFVNYGFYFGASKYNLEKIQRLDPQTVCGIKLFVGASSDTLLSVKDNPFILDDPLLLENIFANTSVLLAAQCEDLPTILENEESYRQIYGDDIPFALHPRIRDHAACYKASQLAVNLAQQFNTPLHLLHLSTEQELQLLTPEVTQEKLITSSTCPHFLTFSEEDYEKQGALIKTTPAIKGEADRAALLQGVLENRIDTIGSDHVLYSLYEKTGEVNPPIQKTRAQRNITDSADAKLNYLHTPSGMPSLQYALLAILENYHDGIFSLELIAEKTSHAVARRFHIQERGFIREGYWADLVLLDVDQTQVIDHTHALSACAWTPYAGMTFRSSIYATLVNGKIVWRNGLFRELGLGMPLTYQR